MSVVLIAHCIVPYICACMYMNAHVRTYVRICMHIYVCTCTYVHVCMHTYVHVHVCLPLAASYSYPCRYYNQLRRHNYVTPTSYLELILTFKKLVQAKRTEIQTLQQRYVTGLEKLEFAASQVELGRGPTHIGTIDLRRGTYKGNFVSWGKVLGS